jgi:hypothetical protein
MLRPRASELLERLSLARSESILGSELVLSRPAHRTRYAVHSGYLSAANGSPLWRTLFAPLSPLGPGVHARNTGCKRIASSSAATLVVRQPYPQFTAMNMIMTADDG